MTIGPVEIMVINGPFDGQVIRLNAPNNRFTDFGPGYLFGRRESCDFPLPYDRWVSGRHARLYAENGKWYLEDLRSTNHTYIGLTRPDHSFAGKAQIQGPQEVSVGTMFQIGRIWLRIQKA
jgi:pSer/pThr/pTyr-binding forkhead associated (FHA) protein